MFCNNCGNKLNNGETFCSNCGTKVVNNNINNSSNNSETNIFAILGIIFAIVIFPVGFILSIIGLIKSKEYGNGKGLSIAGIIISIVPVLLIICIAIFGVVFSASLWPSIKNEIMNVTYCANATNCTSNGDGTYSCKYYDEEENEYIDITCDEEYLPVEEETTTTKKVTTTTKITYEESIDKNAINVYVFYWADCPHCQDLHEYLSELKEDDEIKDKFNIIDYEITDEDNKDLMYKVADYFNISVSGVPFYVIGNNYYKGFSESSEDTIKNAIIDEYSNSTHFDIMDVL